MMPVVSEMTVGVFEGVTVRKGTAGGSSVTTVVFPAQAVNISKRNKIPTILGMGRLYTFHLPTPSGCAKLSLWLTRTPCYRRKPGQTQCSGRQWMPCAGGTGYGHVTC